ARRAGLRRYRCRVRPQRRRSRHRQAPRSGKAPRLYRRAPGHEGARYGRGRRLQHRVDGACGKSRRTGYGQNAPDLGGRAKERLEARMKTPVMAHVVMLQRPFDDPLPAEARDFDLITFFFYYHDTTYMPVDRAEMNRKLYAALKPGGTLVIADHSARPGDGVAVGKTFHRIEESVLRGEVEAVGFKLVAEGNFLRHPEDTRDFSVNRPTGPVDEFVLRYQKPN